MKTTRTEGDAHPLLHHPVLRFNRINLKFFIEVFNDEHKNQLDLCADRTNIGGFSLLFNKSKVTRPLPDTIPLDFMSNLLDGAVLSSLDERAAINRNRPIATVGNEAVNLGEHQEWPGIVPIHDYDAAHLDKIWGDVEKEKKAMLHQKEEYERARTEEIETRKKLADQTSERARLRRDWEARGRLLRTQQEEREQRYLEEQRLLKQELAKLKFELHQKDRELQTRLEHQGEENRESLPGHDEDDCPSRHTNIL